MKYHPLKTAKESEVLAVRFGENRYGLIRILRGSALGIWNRWTPEPMLLPHDAHERPEKWFCHYLSSNKDDSAMVVVGRLPFDTDEQAWAPPCFYPPDIFQNRRIYFKGMFREADADDVIGMEPCERLTPALLVERLQELFSEGLLFPGLQLPDAAGGDQA